MVNWWLSPRIDLARSVEEISGTQVQSRFSVPDVAQPRKSEIEERCGRNHVSDSARNLLKKGLEPGGLGEYTVEEIEISEPEGMSVIAFSIPEMIKRWSNRIREIALDSACRWRDRL